jgi:hypothetical protein
VNSGKSMGDTTEQRVGLGVSVALHLLVVLYILRAPVVTVPETTTIDVTFEAPQTAPRKQQIVSPPESKAEKPPENTDRLSDVDATAIKEQIKRGTEGGLPNPPAKPQPPVPESKPQPPREAPRKEPPTKAEQPVKQPAANQPAPQHNAHKDLNLKDLKLDDATLAMKFGNISKNAPAAAKASQSAPDLSNYEAFSRPPGSGATFVGSGGISDHLPNLPDGDITLLNAKANTYAGFVRRVAVQVFAQLRSQGWEKLSMSEVRRISDFTTIEAILSPEGRFVTMRLVEGSGSPQFDAVVKQAVPAGMKDPNPPAGARASDGMIHFIFKARSWAAIGAGRGGAPSEHRWILLATGLE